MANLLLLLQIVLNQLYVPKQDDHFEIEMCTIPLVHLASET